jgi:cobalt-zinc-cadmium efflux system membrane fusion protein
MDIAMIRNIVTPIKIDHMKYLILLISIGLMACQSSINNEHAHDANGGHIDESEEIPTIVNTIWTDKSELFVEFPALIVGKESRFAAHFTFLEKHQAVAEGSVTVSLIGKEKGSRQTVDSPASIGIFKPALTPLKAGIYQLVFELKTATISDKIVINDVAVFANLQDAIQVIGNHEEGGGAITFLKEQAWKIDFQTAPAVKEEIYTIIPTSGVWDVAPSDYKTIVSTTNGIVNFLSEDLTEGSKLIKGQIIATVNSSDLNTNNLSSEIQKAKAAYEQAKSEFDRKSKLYDSEIIPKSEFEAIQEKFQVAKSNYETLSTGYTDGGKRLVVPFDGFIKAISVGNGDFVKQGDPILAISKHQSCVLKIQLSSDYRLSKQDIKEVWYKTTTERWSSLMHNNGKILSVGKEVNRKNPLVSVFAKVNEFVEMPEGSFTEVQIAYGKSKEGISIPEAALLEDYGKYTVIVQLSGESFERREVSIGKRNGEKVEIINGLQLGEVVVTKGAYQVKMASMSGQAPAHGHDH